MDVSQLSEAQQIALQQYTSVTDQDLEPAVALLQSCQWNAQIAITRFFDGDAETVDPIAEQAAAAAAIPAQANRRTEALIDTIPTRDARLSQRVPQSDLAPRVVPTPESQLTQPLPFPLSIIFLPINLAVNILQRVLGTLGYLFPFLPRLFARLYSGRASQPSRDTRRRALNPRDNAERFMREFEEEYGVSHGIVPFHEGGYAQAFDLAKREIKHLVVILLSPEHDDTPSFVRDTLLAPEFLEFLEDPTNNVILWGGSVRDAEAYQVATALNVTRFPYVCMIAHTPSVSATAMLKTATSSGPVTASDLMVKLRAAMATHREELERIRRQRQDQEATRNLRQEQESAYERSLAQDREKARKRKEEAAAQDLAEKERREEGERKAQHARDVAQWRRWRAQSLSAEPGADSAAAVRVSIRTTKGDRLVRRFESDATLEELYAFVECYEILESTSNSEKRVDAPSDFQHEYKFRLVSPMPREVLELAKGGTLRQRIGRSANLIVESILDEDEEEKE